MSEPTYPRAWAIFATLHGGQQYPRQIYQDRISAERALQETSITVPSVVELIPRPEVERLIAEAVAAERERWKAIVDKCKKEAFCDDPDTASDFEYAWWNSADWILREAQQ